MKPFLLILVLSLGALASACGESGVSCGDLGCDDGNACTQDSCNPANATCESAPVADGSSCTLDVGLGVCEAGACIEDPCSDAPGCGFPGMGRVEIHLQFAMASPAEVFLEANCEGWVMKAYFFPRDGDIWRLVGPLPTGTCTGRFVANDETGGTLCTSDTTFDVNATPLTKIDTVVACTPPAL